MKYQLNCQPLIGMQKRIAPPEFCWWIATTVTRTVTFKLTNQTSVNMSKVITATFGILLLAGQVLGQSQEADLVRFAEAVKPLPEELKWQKIPWILDLAEGQRLARAEGRPIFLWASGDPPLERC